MPENTADKGDRIQTDHQEYPDILMNAPIGVFTSTPEGRFVSANHSMARMLGYASPEELLSSVKDIARQHYADSADREFMMQALNEHGEVNNQEFRMIRTDGTVFWVSRSARVVRDSAGTVIQCQGFVTDITKRKQTESENKKLQSQLLQAQKMESIGILAGGVAHDFNNLLQVVSGNVELLMHGKAHDHPDSTRLNSVSRSLDRAARLISQLLLFARKAGSRRVKIDLNQVVRETLQFLERTIPKMIALETRLDPGTLPLFADPVQIEQILLNLASNSVDAMPEGGKLIIETGNATLDEGFVSIHPGSTIGCNVFLTVTDTGAGMDREAQAHVYDPFFTTKEVGKGTGLGLASVYGIVKSHCGCIQCFSEPGLGTTFTIHLPAVEDGLASEKDNLKETTLPHGSETILVVDDEPDILELTKDSLEMLGYRVQCAASGEEALRAYRDHGNEIELVLLDLNMPGMGGYKCLQELLQLDPSVRVVIASGYTASSHDMNAFSAGARGFIGKPCQIKDLAAGVRKALDTIA